MPTYTVSPTPNPNSMKITTDAGSFVESGMIAANTSDDVAPNTLADRLLAIDGVTDVLILPDFATVSKSAATPWDDVLPAVEAILDDHFASKTS